MPFDEYKKRITDAKRLDELDGLEQELFGRKSGVLTLAFKNLHTLPPDKKRQEAARLNTLKEQLDLLIRSHRGRLLHVSHQTLASTPFDLTLPPPPKEWGHLHLIPSFMTQVEEVFGRMGFDTAYGPEIETEEMNFDLLNFPPDHPARDAQDIFYVKIPNLKKGASKPVLRAHTSPVQVHYMRTHKPPFRMICPGRVFRRDSDATHSPVFHQFEGLMLGEDISLAHMKGVMIAAVKELLSPDITWRFRTGYFPFVEPGLEMDIQWQGAEKMPEGKPVSAELRRGAGWLEIAGCGMVHPNVLKNAKIDPKKWQGFAFGFGIERLLMIKHQIPDIRLFYEGDVRFLRQF